MGTYSIFGVVVHAICLIFSLFLFFFCKGISNDSNSNKCAKEFQMTFGNSEKEFISNCGHAISLSVFFYLSRKQTHPGVARSNDCFGDDLEAMISDLHKNSNNTNMRNEFIVSCLDR